MIEVKNFSGGLNLDDALDGFPPQDYIYADNISHDAVAGNSDKDITNIVANRIGDATYNYPSGTNKCIGAHANTLRNTIIQFNWNSQGKHHILEFNLTTRLITKIFENLTDSGDVDILGFTQEGKILSINIFNRDEGDLLFFLDSLGRPTGMDIDLFKAGEYTPVTRAIIDKGKKPPLSPPSVVYDNDTTRRSNNFRNKLMRFKYRWIYDDYEKSSFSPISKVPLPISILDDTFTNIVTNNNVISMVANTGDKNVKAIEIAMSYVEKTNDWSDFLSVQVIEKSKLGLVQTTTIGGGMVLYDQAYTTFSGVVVAGAVVNMYLTLSPNTKTLVATYTVVVNDTLNDVVDGLVASMAGIGIITSYVADDNSLLWLYYNPDYTFDEVEIIQSTDDVDNIDFAFQFYNDSTYPAIDIEESIQLFDYVPDKANAQEMPNGNILAYIGITEGYDKDTVENAVITVGTIAASGSGGGSSFSAVKVVIPQSDPTKQVLKYTLSGVPAVGTVVEVKVKRRSDHVVLTASTYTTVLGDTIYTVEAALAANNTLYPTNEIVYGSGSIFVHTSNVTYEEIETGFYSSLVITSPTGSITTNSIATWKWLTERNIARGYFDEKGKTNGILYTDKVTMPAYDENGSSQPLLPFINYKIYDVPPSWAYSMQFYITKEETDWKFWVTNSVNKDETAYIYFDVTNFTTNATKNPTTAVVLSWTFKDGDRVRVIRQKPPSAVLFDDTYDAAIAGFVVDPIINLVPKTGTFIKIKNVEPFTTGISASENYVIEIYRPVQQSANKSNQVYYEFGEQYDIIDPTLSTRRHSGQVTDQVVGSTPAEFNFYEGDAYYRERTISISEIGYAIYNVMDRNFVDNYISAVNSLDGRPSIIDSNARRAYYSTLIRHGLAYEANTSENKLNRFYSKNFDEYDYSFGDALAMKIKNRQLIIFQKYKIGNVPLFSSIGKDSNGLTVVFQTDKLLNPIQYYAGDFGIGTCPESLASFNYAIYGCDNIKGVIWRLSNDGIQPLSILYKVNTWANEYLSQKYTDYKVYGAFDQRLNNYIIAISTNDTVCVGGNVPSITLPDGYIDNYYTYSKVIYGTAPFTISNEIKPDWMTISASGNTITFSGTPDVFEDDIPVSFDIENACGNDSVSLTLNILEMTSGTILMWGGSPSSPPSGWLVCDGSAPSRTTYAALFAIVGVTYGVGDGSTTFNLPNLKQRVPAGYDAGAAGYNALGTTGGTGTVTLIEANLPAHTHFVATDSDAASLNVYPWTAGRAVARANPTEPSNAEYRLEPAANGILATTGTSSSVGSGTAADTRDKYIVFSFIIKT